MAIKAVILECTHCGARGYLGEDFRRTDDWCRKCNYKVSRRWEANTNNASRPLATHSRQPWTLEELDILQQAMDQGIPTSDLIGVLPRSWSAIKFKRHQLRREIGE